MSTRTFNILFLCTGNSARSVLAEAYANHASAGRLRAYSAGSHPTGNVNPYAIELLERRGIATDGLRSKAWDDFATPGAPQMDCVITVCDSAAGEVCPLWPGQPVSAHWGVPDPAAVTGEDAAKREAFKQAFGTLKRRIDALLAIPLERLEPPAAVRVLRDIGTLS